MTDVEAKAWELYCEATLGCLDVRDYWEDLSPPTKTLFLYKALCLDSSSSDNRRSTKGESMNHRRRLEHVRVRFEYWLVTQDRSIERVEDRYTNAETHSMWEGWVGLSYALTNDQIENLPMRGFSDD